MVAKPFRCEACNAVEHHEPFKLCMHCHDDFRQIRALATTLRKRFDMWHVPTIEEVFKRALNRLVALVNQKP